MLALLECITANLQYCCFKFHFSSPTVVRRTPFHTTQVFFADKLY